MKRSNDDIELGKLLKEAPCEKAGENVWFTPRVLNRLPQKEVKSYGMAVLLCYIVGTLACLAALIYALYHQNLGAITITDIYTYATLTVLLLAFSIATIREAVK